MTTQEKPYLEAHLTGPSTAEITMLFVPKALRGQGIATKLFKDFEASLPATVERVTLFAADTDGNGNSDPFWEKLGFDWKYQVEAESDCDYEMYHTLWKGVNGHPTPQAIVVEPEDVGGSASPVNDASPPEHISPGFGG